MLIVAELGAEVRVEHRTIKSGDTSGVTYCDAPTEVNVGFGSYKRTAILWRSAASDGCVRDALLKHYEQHRHAFDATVRRFVLEWQPELQSRLETLKSTAYPDRAAAIAGFEQGLRSLLAGITGLLEEALDRSREEIDRQPHLEELRRQCDGKLRDMEDAVTRPGGAQRAAHGA
jgi:hypothetical protein